MKTPAVVGLVALVLGAVLTAGAPASAVVAPGSVKVKDHAHDVRVYRKVTGLSRFERTSIDLRTVTVSPREGDTRFTVRLGKVLRTRKFDQMVFLTLAPPPGSTETWSGMIGMSPQRPGLAYAGLDAGNGTDYESCDPLKVGMLRRTSQLRLDVPTRCLPEGQVSVSVRSLTGYFRSDAGRPWSQDRLRFPAPVELR